MTIKPYKIAIPKAELDELHRRIKETRWPIIVLDNDWSRGVPQAYLKKLSDYWLHKFDWRKQEAWLNTYDQYIAEVDGQPIHFFHVKSKEPSATPVMLLHGWPSSGVEYVKLLDALTDPVAHGGKAEDAFHVVIPTIPGFGLSSPVQEKWDVPRTTKAFNQIMQELGYERYGAVGGDIGGGIASALDQINKNMTGVLGCTDLPAIIWLATFTGADPAQNPHVSDAQKKEVQALVQARKDGDGYLAIQTTRPTTIGYLLNDTPVGLLAWMIEKYKEWTDDGTKLPEETLDLDHALTNITLYWLTGSGAAAADFLYNNTHAEMDWAAMPNAPTGMVCFGAKSNLARTLMDPDKTMPHWTEYKTGGHFPAMEVPELVSKDVRAFFRGLRS